MMDVEKRSFFLKKKLVWGKKFLKNEGFLGMVVLGPYSGPIGRGETRSGQSKKRQFFLKKTLEAEKITIFDVGN